MRYEGITKLIQFKGNEIPVNSIFIYVAQILCCRMYFFGYLQECEIKK